MNDVTDPWHQLLSDLRARRLARRWIELEESLAVATCDPRDGADLVRDREVLVMRLERAAARLEQRCSLRIAIDEACTAHHDCAGVEQGSDHARIAAERFAIALLAVRDAMRRSGRPCVASASAGTSSARHR